MPASEDLPGDYRVISPEEAEARFTVSTDVEYPYLDFANHQAIRVYECDVHVPGDVRLSNLGVEDDRSHNVVVDGDLVVNGDLTLDNDEGTGFFVLVTGGLRARNLFLSGFPNLAVRGDLTVANGVQGSYGEDGGYLAVDGATIARIVVNTPCFRMYFGGPVRAVVAGDPYRTSCPVDYTDEDDLPSVLRPELLGADGCPDAGKIGQALGDGRPVLRPTAVPRHLAAIAELDALLARAGDVTTIDLSERNLRTVPEQVFGFSELRSLSLAGNDEISELPPRIGELAHLEELDVSGTGLTELPPAIGQLTALRVLNISNTGLSALPDEIGDLRSLTVLRARRFEGQVPDALARLSALEELELELPGNGPVDFPLVVTRLPRLRTLDLSGSPLASVPDQLLSLLTLEELNLDRALGHVQRLPDLSRLPRLRVLHVNGGVRSGPYPRIHLLASVWGVTTLEELCIDRWSEQKEYNPASREHEVVRPALANLPDGAFTRMPRLLRLDLSFNELTTLPPSFYELEHLAFVDLRYTNLDASTLGRLRDHFPRVRMDLRHVATRADSDDPAWQAVHTLVQEGAAMLSGSPADAIPRFEQAIARCGPGDTFSDYDQLYALYGLVEAIGRIVVANGDTGGELVDKLIGYAERALALVPDPAMVWHFTDEGAFQQEVTRRAANALGWYLMRRGEHDRALAAIDRALAVAEGSEHDYVRDTKVRILQAMGRTHDAYLIADAVLTREPNFTDLADVKALAEFQEWRRTNSVVGQPAP